LPVGRGVYLRGRCGDILLGLRGDVECLVGCNGFQAPLFLTQVGFGGLGRGARKKTVGEVGRCPLLAFWRNCRFLLLHRSVRCTRSNALGDMVLLSVEEVVDLLQPRYQWAVLGRHVVQVGRQRRLERAIRIILQVSQDEIELGRLGQRGAARRAARYQHGVVILVDGAIFFLLHPLGQLLFHLVEQGFSEETQLRFFLARKALGRAQDHVCQRD